MQLNGEYICKNIAHQPTADMTHLVCALLAKFGDCSLSAAELASSCGKVEVTLREDGGVDLCCDDAPPEPTQEELDTVCAKAGITSPTDAQRAIALQLIKSGQ